MRENILINDRFPYHNTKTRKDILPRQRKKKGVTQPRNHPESLQYSTLKNSDKLLRKDAERRTQADRHERRRADRTRHEQTDFSCGDLVQKALISIIPPSRRVALIIFLSHLCLSLCLSSDEPVCDAKETISFASLVQFFSCFTWDWLMWCGER